MYRYIDSEKEGNSFLSSETYLLEHDETTETIEINQLFAGNWRKKIGPTLGKQTHFAHIGLEVTEDGKSESKSNKLYDYKTSYMSIQLGRL
jgi:hypothetical protein